MKALILAAGVGERPGQAAVGVPKCLLSFAGATLLERHLVNIESLGIEEVVIGIGHKAQAVGQALKQSNHAKRTRCVFNPAYRRGSVVTLWAMRDVLRTGDSVLIMDADVLYDARILLRLVRSAHDNCLAFDRDFEEGEEPVKACVLGGQLVELRKRVSCAYDYCGESVGFFKLSADAARELAEITERYVEMGRADAPHDLILSMGDRFGFEDVSGLSWIEIDFPRDVERAQTVVAPKLAGSVRIAS